MVSRSFAATKSIMPPSANSASGKTSVAAGRLAGLRAVGRRVPGGDRGLRRRTGRRRSSVRSPISSSDDDAEHGRIVPCRNSVGPSIGDRVADRGVTVRGCRATGDRDDQPRRARRPSSDQLR